MLFVYSVQEIEDRILELTVGKSQKGASRSGTPSCSQKGDESSHLPLASAQSDSDGDSPADARGADRQEHFPPDKVFLLSSEGW